MPRELPDQDKMISEGTIEPEVWENMNVDDLANLGLPRYAVMAVVAFMETLSYGYRHSR